MSKETHRQFLEKAALREAQKAIHRSGDRRPTVAELSKLKIPTLEPWKRVLLGMLGVGACIGGVALGQQDILWLGVPLILLGLWFIAAAFGRRRTVEGALNGVDLVSLFEIFLD